MFMKKKALKIFILSLIGLLLIFSIGSFVFTKSFYDGNFRRVEQPKITGLLRYGDLSGYDRTVVHFPSGQNQLTGYIYGEENNQGLVVISHGLGYGSDDYLAETVYFVDKGWRVLAFDNTGVYASAGQSEKGLPQSALDLDAALKFVESDADLSKLPLMLFGHSWGGYAVAAVLNFDHPVRAVASVAGFNSPNELVMEQLKSETGILGYLEYPFAANYQRRLFGKNAGLSAVNGINGSNTPVLIIHGIADEAIAYNGASIISHRDEITNPNVVYKTCDVAGQDGHKTLLKSAAAINYAKKINAEYKAIFDQYDGKIPDSVNAEFYGKVDKFLASQLDPNLMDADQRFL